MPDKQSISEMGFMKFGENLSESSQIWSEMLSDPGFSEQIELWLNENGHKWIMEKRPGFGAVIEACSEHQFMPIVPYMLEVLLNQNSDDLVASIAAQRLRRLTESYAIGYAVKANHDLINYWIKRWLNTGQWNKAKLAIPSVLTLHPSQRAAWIDDLNFLRDLIGFADITIAKHAALTLAYYSPPVQNQFPEQFLAITETAISRISHDPNIDQEHFRGTLAEMLGFTGTKHQLEAVAMILAFCFCEPRGTISDNSALHGGKKLLSRFEQTADAAIKRAFENRSQWSENFGRWQELLNNWTLKKVEL